MSYERRELIPTKEQSSSNKEQRAAQRGAWRIATDLPSSFRYAAQGISYSLRSQRNFRIQLFIGALVFAISLWLQLNRSDLAILLLMVIIVLVLELINTSIEAVVDLSIGRQFHPLARIAKDCAAAAVLLASISSLLIACLLLLPELLFLITA